MENWKLKQVVAYFDTDVQHAVIIFLVTLT